MLPARRPRPHAPETQTIRMCNACVNAYKYNHGLACKVHKFRCNCGAFFLTKSNLKEHIANCNENKIVGKIPRRLTESTVTPTDGVCDRTCFWQ